MFSRPRTMRHTPRSPFDVIITLIRSGLRTEPYSKLVFSLCESADFNTVRSAMFQPDYYKDAPHFHRVGDGPEYRLEIPCAKLDYTGAYSVIAKNCHGEAKAVISLQITAKGESIDAFQFIFLHIIHLSKNCHCWNVGCKLFIYYALSLQQFI